MNQSNRSRARLGTGVVRRAAAVLLLGLSVACPATMGQAQENRDWAATWTTAQQGAFVAPTEPATVVPVGDFRPEVFFPQPNFIRFALPEGKATDQTFRMMVRPDIWSDTIRIRLSNVFGKEPLVIGSAAVGLQEYSAHLVPGTSAPVMFDGQPTVTIAPGERVFSDPVTLPFYTEATSMLLRGRNLAVSFAVIGTNAALSYHDSAEASSYISEPGSGDVVASDSGADFPFTTSSWFILDAVDVMAPEGTKVVIAFGNSIADGTLSTHNGNDRWPDFLSHRLDAIYGDTVSVVIQAMSGNAIVSEAIGEPAIKRLQRDVLEVSGVTTVILMEGINDLGSAQNTPEPVIEGYKEIAARLKEAGITVIAGTLTPGLRPDQDFSKATLGTVYGPYYGGTQTDTYRKVLNEFIRTSGTFDGVIDFEAALLDPATGAMKDVYIPNSDGGPGDWLHPNRIGLQAMGAAIDPAVLNLGAVSE